MDFFDKLGEAARNLTEKAGDGLETNRLNGEIAIEKGNIQCFQRELGEHYWAKFVVGEKLDEEAMLICDKVVVSQDRIRQMEIDIEKIKKEREAVLAERTKAKQTETEEEQPKEEGFVEGKEPVLAEERDKKADGKPRFCANCGGAIKAEQRFCMFCGAEVKE
ncbi:MAG: hypothetical protein PHG19_10130 [Anaerotignum sp.]|nr:hypothetical protein [Anaerotignum sp.]